MHLTLDPQPYQADGLTLRLEDFELRLLRGSLFTTPASLGPTMLLFVGEGEVRRDARARPRSASSSGSSAARPR